MCAVSKRGRVNAFRSEVDTLRSVIRKTVNDVVEQKLGDIEEVRSRLELAEKSLKGRKPIIGRAGPAPDLTPLKERIARLEMQIGTIEDMVSKAKVAGAPIPGMKDLTERVRRLEMGIVSKGGNAKGIDGRSVEGVIENMVESKAGSLNNKILMLKREIDMLRGQFESSRVKSLEEDFHKGIGSLRAQVNKTILDSKSIGERLGSEIETLKREIANLGKAGGNAGGINVEELKRDLEIIKTKQEWIENNIERIDIKPLMQKMEELEHRIRVISISSPVVLE